MCICQSQSSNFILPSAPPPHTRFLTQRKCEMINVYFFKVLNFGEICYVEINNQYISLNQNPEDLITWKMLITLRLWFLRSLLCSIIVARGNWCNLKFIPGVLGSTERGWAGKSSQENGWWLPQFQEVEACGKNIKFSRLISICRFWKSLHWLMAIFYI